MNNKKGLITTYIIPLAIVIAGVLLVATSKVFFRIDLTGEKRYSLADSTRKLLAGNDKPLDVTLYLCGDLDANLLRLSHAVEDMVYEMNNHSKERISIATFDPNSVSDDDSRYALYTRLENRGMRGMNVSVRRRKGQLSEQVIFPWAEMCSATDTVQICLMQPSGKLSGEEAVNLAIEDLEFQLADAVRILTAEATKRIAFIEGHGEWSEAEVYDATDALSRYFYVDRGTLGLDASVLDNYAAIIVAGPKTPLSETDKFIIDQYIMGGGRVLWMVDGTQMSSAMLSTKGTSPIIAHDVNLADMLFRYGVRITPSVIEDMQCAYVPVNISRPGDEPRFEPIPWFFTPLLQTSPLHPITKTIGAVRADFASGIEIVGDTVDTRKSLLLASSNASHVGFAPNAISVGAAIEVEPQQYFTNAYIPVAVAIEGKFTSIYRHRMPPEGMTASQQTDKSPETRMVVVADADIIKNEVEQHNGNLSIVPLGYDRLTYNTYGNRNFIVNTLLYLTDDEGVMELRNRRIELRLLNKATAETYRSTIMAIAVTAPILLFAIIAAIYALLHIRSTRYSNLK